MVQVLNLRLSDFVAAPTSLADLAFADHAGNPIENAGDLGAIVGLLTTLPSEVRMTPAKGSPAVPATFKSGKHSYQRTQLVLEPLRSPLEPFHVVGLRIHCLLYDNLQPFPFLTSSIWRRIIDSNNARKKREALKARPVPVNPDPAAGAKYVASMATLGKSWRRVLGDGITGARKTVEDWVAAHRSSVANVAFEEAIVMEKMQLRIHRLSPEWLLRFSSETLLLRCPHEASTEHLRTDSYFKPFCQSYTFPNPADCYVYAGDSNAFHAPLPVALANALMRGMEELGGGGMSYQGSLLSDAVPTRKRKRHVDLDVDGEESEESDSEE